MTSIAPTRPRLLRRALRRAYVTVGWNLVEGAVAMAAALAAQTLRSGRVPWRQAADGR